MIDILRGVFSIYAILSLCFGYKSCKDGNLGKEIMYFSTTIILVIALWNM